MNRNQFWILVAGSGLVVLFLLLQVLFTNSLRVAQGKVAAAEQLVSQGRSCDTRLRQLASRIYQVSVQTQDQGLKDLLARQQIIVNPPTSQTDAPTQSGATPTPAR